MDFEICEQFDVEGASAASGASYYAKIVCDEPESIFDNNSLILDAFVRQLLILSLPAQNLCSYGWEGDCPVAKKQITKQQVVSGHPAFDRLKYLKTDQEVES